MLRLWFSVPRLLSLVASMVLHLVARLARPSGTAAFGEPMGVAGNFRVARKRGILKRRLTGRSDRGAVTTVVGITCKAGVRGSPRMKPIDEYHRWVEWSDEDQVYIGKCPD